MIILIESIVSVFMLPEVTKGYTNYYNAITSGIISGFTLTHFIPEVNVFNGHVAIAMAFLYCLFIEKYFFHVHEHSIEYYGENNALVSLWSNVIGISFHAIVAGITLGNTDEMVPIFTIIVSHKLFTGYCLAMKYRNLNYKKYFPFLVFTLTTPLSAIFSKYGILKIEDTSILNGISAGTFLYLGLNEMLVDVTEKYSHNISTRHKYLYFILICLGIMTSLILTKLTIHDHNHDHHDDYEHHENHEYDHHDDYEHHE